MSTYEGRISQDSRDARVRKRYRRGDSPCDTKEYLQNYRFRGRERSSKDRILVREKINLAADLNMAQRKREGKVGCKTRRSKKRNNL